MEPNYSRDQCNRMGTAPFYHPCTARKGVSAVLIKFGRRRQRQLTADKANYKQKKRTSTEIFQPIGSQEEFRIINVLRGC
jgi:hypothetical protein